MFSKSGIPMTRRQKIRIIRTIVLIILTIMSVERIYNMKDEFHVSALDASEYGMVEIKLTSMEKIKDFEYLCSVLEENYPFFKVNERLHNINWLENKNKYKRIIRNTKNDAEYFVALNQILSDLNNIDVNVLNGYEYKSFFKTYYEHYSNYEEPYKYLSAYEAFSNPYVMVRYQFDGKLDDVNILTSEAGLETKILVDDEIAYMKIKNMGHYNTSKEDRLKIKNFLKKIEDYEKLIIDIRGNIGRYDSYWEYIVSLLINEEVSRSYYSFFKNSYIHKFDPYKISNLKSINLLDEKTLSKFPEEIKTDFDYYKINDISISPLEINTNSSDYIDFKGKVYLLVDSKVFSSAEKFASFAKDAGFATLVGEPTGGHRVFEDVPLFSLPKSKFVFRCSRELGINGDGTINMETKTIPHILVDPTPNEDFTKDKCIQAVIND